MRASCVHCRLACSLGMMIPDDVQAPGLLVELPAVAQRREQEDRSIIDRTAWPSTKLLTFPFDLVTKHGKI